MKEGEGKVKERFTIQNEKHINFPTVNTIDEGNEGKTPNFSPSHWSKKNFFGFL